MEKPPEIVTASEIAVFVYGPESFRLAARGADKVKRIAVLLN